MARAPERLTATAADQIIVAIRPSCYGRCAAARLEPSGTSKFGREPCGRFFVSPPPPGAKAMKTSRRLFLETVAACATTAGLSALPAAEPAPATKAAHDR